MKRRFGRVTEVISNDQQIDIPEVLSLSVNFELKAYLSENERFIKC